MRLGNVLALVFCATSLATPSSLSPRDTSIIERHLNIVTWAERELMSAIKALNSSLDPSHDIGIIAQVETDIETKSRRVIDALKKGASEIDAGPRVQVAESLGLIDKVTASTSVTSETMHAWLNAKPTIVKFGGRVSILSILAEAQKQLDSFTDAIVSKIPLSGQASARRASRATKELVQRVVDAYSKP